MSETLDIGGESSAEGTYDDGPWGREYQESVPPFNGGEKQSPNTSENSEISKVESGDYNIFEGVEYKNIDKIDISTDQGKFEWLDSLVSNANTRLEHEHYNIIGGAGFPSDASEEELEDFFEYDDAYQDNKRESDIVKRQSKILENLDINGEGGILGAIERRRDSFAKIMNNPNASSEAQEIAYHNWEAAQELHSVLSEEMARRDPNYFGQDEMQITLDSEIKASERRVEQFMIDGYFGEDGFIHKTPNGEKMPSAATEDAEIDLKNAKQDAETFSLLMNNYQAANNYMAPRAIRKEDFASTVDEFIEDHTNQINQLMVELKTLTEGTAEYAENEARRRQLAKERSSAKRLSARYFNIPRAETSSDTSTPETLLAESDFGDGEASMGQAPTGKTEEQTKTEAGERQQEQSPTSYHFEGGLVDKDVTITVGQEIPDEWFESKTYEDSDGGGFGMKITQPPQIEDYLSQALNIEFGKLSESERQRYNYPALIGAIVAEARRTKKIPDITNIISQQRIINEQRKKVE